MAETTTKLENISQDSKTIHAAHCSVLTDRIARTIKDDLPLYIERIAEFEECRIQYLYQYRVLFITHEGLGIDMDRQQNDINYFQLGEQDIQKEYEQLDVQYISERKAKKYKTYGLTAMFRTIWSDLRKRLTADH